MYKMTGRTREVGGGEYIVESKFKERNKTNCGRVSKPSF